MSYQPPMVEELAWRAEVQRLVDAMCDAIEQCREGDYEPRPNAVIDILQAAIDESVLRGYAR